MNAHSRPDVRLSRLLWQWLFTGLALIALFPAARGNSALIGWLPFWLCLAPVGSLAVLYRHALASTFQRRASQSAIPPNRPRPRRSSQARRLAPAIGPRHPRLRAA